MTNPLDSVLPRRPLIERIPSWALLLTGGLITVATGPRWGIAALAWIAPLPYLLFARRARGVRPWLALLGTLLAGFCMQCVLFATPPVPVIGVILFGPPLALLRFGAIGLGELARRRLGERAGLLAYVTATVGLDWLGYGMTELGAWMSTANTQVEFLAFLQLASLAGLAGLGALMAWTAGAVTMWIAGGRAHARPAIAAAIAMTAALGWGTCRLDSPVPGKSVTVAAVVTTVGPDENGLPGPDALARNTDTLFERTRSAAIRGARVIVWNEVATLVSPAEEPAFIARARAIAREHRIDLVLAYAVLETSDPILFDNKYLFIDDRGEVLDRYQKHHPVPGEPSIRGTGALRVLERPYGRVGGAICYDYDFPAMAREHARAGAELVVLPSSDWRGIDPVHTFMSRVRAIESGFSLVRAVRWAPSAAFDAHGRVRAWMPAIDDNDGILIARVPVGQTPTLATAIGDAPALLALGIVLAMLGLIGVRRLRNGRPIAAS